MKQNQKHAKQNSPTLNSTATLTKKKNFDAGKWLAKGTKNVLKHWQLYAIMIPAILFYIFFMYRPMWGLQIAFKNFKIFTGIEKSNWVGFAHFVKFIESPYFWRNLKNTLLINVYGLLFGFPIPILLALMLNEVKNIYFKKTIQTMTYLPHFISIVVIAGIVVNFLSPSNGLINILIEKLGGEKTNFLVKPEYFRTIFISMNIWKEAGFNAIVYLAALSGIDPNLYEAAYVDGANKFKRILHVTIPGIMPTIIVLLVLKIGSMLSVGYEAIILLYQPATFETADVISTYVYRMGLEGAQYDYAAAVGLFNAIISVLLVVLANRVSKKFSGTSLW